MREKLERVTPAERFWIGLGLYVLTADMILWRRNCDTMSVCFGDWLESPKGKVVCAAGALGLAAHLFWSIPIPGQRKLKTIATYKNGRN